MDITIRDATSSDAALITSIVISALGCQTPELRENLMHVCADINTLYSWENTRILCVDGVPAGGLVAYKGENYTRLRANTWNRCWPDSLKTLTPADFECEPGDYYIDSVALLPLFRKQGLGKHLVLDAVNRAKNAHERRVTLLSSKDKPALMDYYKSLGFQQLGSAVFLGFDFWRMSYNL